MAFCGYQIGSRQVSSPPHLHPVHSWQSQNWLQRLEHSSKSTAFITHPPFPLSSLGPTRSFTTLRSSLLNDRLGFDPENYPRHHIFYKTRQSHCFPSSAEPASLSLYLFKYKNSDTQSLSQLSLRLHGLCIQIECYSLDIGMR